MKDSTELKAAIIEYKVKAFDFIVSARNTDVEIFGYKTKEDLAYGTVMAARRTIEQLLLEWEKNQ